MCLRNLEKFIWRMASEGQDGVRSEKGEVFLSASWGSAQTLELILSLTRNDFISIVSCSLFPSQS